MALTKRQAEIVDAALTLTAQKGIQQLTVKNLSAAIGVTEPALYRHFKNKSEIVLAMIAGFDQAVTMGEGDRHGWAAIEAFVQARLSQVCRKPDLARVLFAEELFQGEAAFTQALLEMMHRHKQALDQCFSEAQAAGEIRSDLPQDTLFRLVLGPVRLLVKQWGMSGYAFDLQHKGSELLESLEKILKN